MPATQLAMEPKKRTSTKQTKDKENNKPTKPNLDLKKDGRAQYSSNTTAG